MEYFHYPLLRYLYKEFYHFSVTHKNKMLSALFVAFLFTGVTLAVYQGDDPPPAYKILTGYPLVLQSGAFTPDTSITSKGCTVGEKNGDRMNTATNEVWEGEVQVDSWPFIVTICSQQPDTV